MTEALRQTKTHLQDLLSQFGINPRTDLGQNYLIDLNIIDFIVREARIGPKDVILEVGTGTGGMTAFMAEYAAHVISVELDRNMHALASAQLGDRPNLTLMRQDALHNKNRFAPEVLAEIEKQLAVDPSRRLKLVANLPYNIATPVVSNLVATDIPWERMIVTIQLELGLRMQARPGKSTYGALSVWLQSQCYVKLLNKLPPSVFWPRPKVNSAVMKLVPNPKGRAQIANRPFLQDFVRRLFHQRRKMLRSVLVGMYRKQIDKQVIDDIMTEMELGEKTRAEELQPQTLVELSNRVYHRINESETASETSEE
ncbi:16S rRNA (adenine(1518)-N(6)/adenine(1519)-N(6))-dimethyltransferase RsmA [Rubinisphaera margarita]|uniref:16S rRNA (adenine(1518)-N(6)/adenine(1519)-N(6))- dimethyltransferase RsmA n=1 Tax=Rubinisphaera margarita TaxID=2909586 RepID=UPI001EE93A40|nr:16S rRNA (adenine(1518)-N(6)/adenine(1519)-N(6))-dimethyltransferase RsmA [Rubinisphaera margarita]MCG6155482.1 16S rRNA (adenine(1518)-N(6)/adenine(1519)-N(6))-dimethyltransferase RsmA [Rubinisphaera margarita]